MGPGFLAILNKSSMSASSRLISSSYFLFLDVYAANICKKLCVIV
jgi:hypothetical protein